jgi:hypothetical protein
MEKPIFYHHRNKEQLEFTGIVPRGNKYRKLNFGYKQSAKGQASKVYFFFDSDYHMSHGEKVFYLYPERQISAKEFQEQLDHASQLFFKELGVYE